MSHSDFKVHELTKNRHFLENFVKISQALEAGQRLKEMDFETSSSFRKLPINLASTLEPISIVNVSMISIGIWLFALHTQILSLVLEGEMNTY